MKNQASDTIYYLFVVATICGTGGFIIATLSAMFGSPLIAMITFYVGVAAILLLTGLGTVMLAGALRSWRRGGAR